MDKHCLIVSITAANYISGKMNWCIHIMW